jgi:DNA (cytosine-5)-methyltransferase 1
MDRLCAALAIRGDSRAMRAADLFAGAGGATRGLQLAGFRVVAVDINPQPRNPADRFIRGNVLELPIEFLREFDFVWSSPPCQKFTSMRDMYNAKSTHLDLISATRELLIEAGKPFAIENVPQAPLRNPILLCGSMFNLDTPCGAELRRHRHIETSFPVSAPKCRHCPGERTIGIYGGHARNRRRPTGTHHVPLTDFTLEDARAAMGVDWPMTFGELSEAIPPIYSRFIAGQWIELLG